jgi:hypothetical protein
MVAVLAGMRLALILLRAAFLYMVAMAVLVVVQFQVLMAFNRVVVAAVAITTQTVAMAVPVV